MTERERPTSFFSTSGEVPFFVCQRATMQRSSRSRLARFLRERRVGVGSLILNGRGLTKVPHPPPKNGVGLSLQHRERRGRSSWLGPVALATGRSVVAHSDAPDTQR